jgi:hypothetical protein
MVFNATFNSISVISWRLYHKGPYFFIIRNFQVKVIVCDSLVMERRVSFRRIII